MRWIAQAAGEQKEGGLAAPWVLRRLLRGGGSRWCGRGCRRGGGGGSGLVLLLGAAPRAPRLEPEFQESLAGEPVLGLEDGADAVAEVLAGLEQVTALAIDLLEVGPELGLPILQSFRIRR